mgnify:CR=1 FL=1
MSTTQQSELGTGLKPRHLTLMGLGTAIGAGLFLGVGVGIGDHAFLYDTQHD